MIVSRVLPTGDAGGRRRGVVAAAATAGVAALGVLAAAGLQVAFGEPEGPAHLAAALRFARYLSTLLAVGGVVLLALVVPAAVPPSEAARRVTVTAALASGLLAALAVPVQAATLAGKTRAAFAPDMLAFVLDSGFGRSVALSVLGAAVLLVAARRIPHAWARLVGVAGALLALGAFLLTGHSATSEPRLLAVGANLIHTAAGAVWLGGLTLLPLVLRDRRRADDVGGAARLLSAFSAAAGWALLAVALAGMTLAWVEVRTPAALATPYGLVLAAKVVLVAAVAALGALNHYWLVPQLTARPDIGGGWARLQATVRLEAAALVGVLALTAVLVHLTPARLEVAADGQPGVLTEAAATLLQPPTEAAVARAPQTAAAAN